MTDPSRERIEQALTDEVLMAADDAYVDAADGYRSSKGYAAARKVLVDALAASRPERTEPTGDGTIADRLRAALPPERHADLDLMVRGMMELARTRGEAWAELESLRQPTASPVSEGPRETPTPLPGRCGTCRHWDELDNFPQGVCQLGVGLPSTSLTLYPLSDHFGCTFWDAKEIDHD